MKNLAKVPSTSVFTAIVALALMPALVQAGEKDDQKKLMAKAKITEAAARATASAQVPDGKVKAVEIEDEDGALVWSFDFTRPKTDNITEIQINALTGKVQKTEIETPADIAKEAKEDAEKSGKENKNNAKK